MPHFQITRQSQISLPSLPFSAMAKNSLGPKYELVLTIATPAQMKKLNKIYRGINKATDILSFPLSKNEGEIYLCPTEAKKEAPKFNYSEKKFLAFLFIHGCVHLKGYEHGATMERIERRLRDKFRI